MNSWTNRKSQTGINLKEEEWITVNQGTDLKHLSRSPGVDSTNISFFLAINVVVFFSFQFMFQFQKHGKQIMIKNAEMANLIKD